MPCFVYTSTICTVEYSFAHVYKSNKLGFFAHTDKGRGLYMELLDMTSSEDTDESAAALHM